MRGNLMTTTMYESLIEHLRSAARKHPRSYVVIDYNSRKLLGTGMDAAKVMNRVWANLKEGQIPMIYKMPKRNEVPILTCL